MSDKKIVMQGKEIDFGEMSDAQVLKLYTEIKERELKLYEQVLELEEEIKYLESLNG